MLFLSSGSDIMGGKCVCLRHMKAHWLFLYNTLISNKVKITHNKATLSSILWAWWQLTGKKRCTAYSSPVLHHKHALYYQNNKECETYLLSYLCTLSSNLCLYLLLPSILFTVMTLQAYCQNPLCFLSCSSSLQALETSTCRELKDKVNHSNANKKYISLPTRFRFQPEVFCSLFQVSKQGVWIEGKNRKQRNVGHK